MQEGTETKRMNPNEQAFMLLARCMRAYPWNMRVTYIHGKFSMEVFKPGTNVTLSGSMPWQVIVYCLSELWARVNQNALPRAQQTALMVQAQAKRGDAGAINECAKALGVGTL